MGRIFLAAINPKARRTVSGVWWNVAFRVISDVYKRQKYGSLDDLISTNYVSVARQRPPYAYAVEVSSGSSGFRVIATRTGDNTSGTPAQLSVDENMEFQTSP